MALVIVVVVALPILLAIFLTKINRPTPKTPTKLSSDLKKGIYKCPSVKEFCLEGRDIIKDKTYVGFGGDVASGSAILASFDGKVTGFSMTLPPQFQSEKLNVIYLDNQENNIRATYYFKGAPINFNEIDTKEGATLGIIKDRMQYYDTFLLFTIVKGDPQKDEKIRLTSKDFITE